MPSDFDTAFDTAAAGLFAAMGQAATFDTKAGGAAVACTVIHDVTATASEDDESGRALASDAKAHCAVSDVAAPTVGDSYTLASGEQWLITAPPRRLGGIWEWTARRVTPRDLGPADGWTE